jgi:hypothetical protein
MFAGVLYWAVWRVVLPRVFHYELVPRKEKLEDGTVVTLVSPLVLFDATQLTLSIVFAEKNGVTGWYTALIVCRRSGFYFLLYEF